MREKILNYIEKNSRVDLKELAVLLGMNEVDVANELAAMEAEGIICGYHTIIDWDKVTEERVNALIEVRVTPQRGKGFRFQVSSFRFQVSGGRLKVSSFRFQVSGGRLKVGG